LSLHVLFLVMLGVLLQDIFVRLWTGQPKDNDSHADRGKKFIYVPERLDQLWSAPVGRGVFIAGTGLPWNESNLSFYVVLVPCVPSWREIKQLWFYALVGGWVGSRDDLEGSGACQVRRRSAGTFLVSKPEQHAAESRYTHCEAQCEKHWMDEMSRTRNKLWRADSWLQILVWKRQWMRPLRI
jgi:hypothetical protein